MAQNRDSHRSFETSVAAMLLLYVAPEKRANAWPTRRGELGETAGNLRKKTGDPGKLVPGVAG
jgi:hypothetical protein